MRSAISYRNHKSAVKRNFHSNQKDQHFPLSPLLEGHLLLEIHGTLNFDIFPFKWLSLPRRRRALVLAFVSFSPFFFAILFVLRCIHACESGGGALACALVVQCEWCLWHRASFSRCIFFSFFSFSQIYFLLAFVRL